MKVQVAVLGSPSLILSPYERERRGKGERGHRESDREDRVTPPPPLVSPFLRLSFPLPLPVRVYKDV